MSSRDHIAVLRGRRLVGVVTRQELACCWSITWKAPRHEPISKVLRRPRLRHRGPPSG